MKTFLFRRSAGLSSLALALVLPLGSIAYAQPNPDHPDRPNPPREGRRFQAAGPAQGAFAMERILTDDQRDSLRQALEAQRDKLRELHEKIRAARQAMMKAALADEFKETTVKARALEVAKLEAELAVIRLKAFAEVQPALSPEQLERVLNLPQPRAFGPEGERPQNRRGPRPPRPADEASPAPRDAE